MEFGCEGIDNESSEVGIIFNNHASPIGSSVSLGNFTAGTELIFRLHVNNTGNDFFTGDAARNIDGKFHARINDTWSSTETLVELEDLLNTPEFPGGFNDLAFSFTNVQSGNVIPEPSTYAMLLAGLALLGFIATRKKNLCV